MFRLGYLLPRLILLLAVCLFLRFGLDPVLAVVFKSALQSAFGAKVDITRLESAPFAGSLRLSNVAVADPQAPLKNMFQFDDAWLHVDSRALQAKRLLIREGMVSGLAFGTERDTSGQLPESLSTDEESPSAFSQYGDRWADQLSGEAVRWFEQLQTRLTADARHEFETIPLAERLSHEWRIEYERRRSEINAWKARIASYQQLVRDLREDPVRHVPALPRYLQDLQQLQADLARTHLDIEQLARRALDDKRALQVAKDHDQARLAQWAQLEGVDPDALTAYLLGSQLHDRLTCLRRWMEAGQSAFDLLVRSPQWNRQEGRGVDFMLARSNDPQVMIERLGLSGMLHSADGPLSFVGLASDLTSEPKRHDKPAVIQLKTSGPVATGVRVEADARGDSTHYRYTFRIPQLRQPPAELGDPALGALAVSEGKAALWGDVRLDGEKVSGQFRWRQDQLRATPLAEGKYAKLILPALKESLAGVDHLHAQVALGGTLKRPTWNIRSNLGSELANGLRSAADEQLQQLQVRLVARLESEAAARAGELDQFVQAHTAELTGVMATVNEIQRQLTGGGGGLMDRLPLRLGELENPLRSFLPAATRR